MVDFSKFNEKSNTAQEPEYHPDPDAPEDETFLDYATRRVNASEKAGTFPENFPWDDGTHNLTFLAEAPHKVTKKNGKTGWVIHINANGQKFTLWCDNIDLLRQLKEILVDTGSLLNRTFAISRRKVGQVWVYTMREMK
jgi:hypothetical protein